MAKFLAIFLVISLLVMVGVIPYTADFFDTSSALIRPLNAISGGVSKIFRSIFPDLIDASGYYLYFFSDRFFSTSADSIIGYVVLPSTLKRSSTIELVASSIPDAYSLKSRFLGFDVLDSYGDVLLSFSIITPIPIVNGGRVDYLLFDRLSVASYIGDYVLANKQWVPIVIKDNGYASNHDGVSSHF